MQQNQFKLIDRIVGWLVFTIAATVYCLTVEPTTSLWDCSEFIISAYKLEIGHPPGAPFFMLTANLFSQFASDPSQVAYMVNIMSALLSVPQGTRQSLDISLQYRVDTKEHEIDKPHRAMLVAYKGGYRRAYPHEPGVR